MKPVLFNTEMVCAILEGRKTVTRRVVKPRPIDLSNNQIGTRLSFPKPPYCSGDILYVRETWADTTLEDGTQGYAYKADNPGTDGCGWRPSIHMPREAARIFLRVTVVRVERLQDITEQQAIAEGFEPFPHEPATAGFVDTWNTIIKPADRALYGWEANPWIWVIEFEKIGREEAKSDGK